MAQQDILVIGAGGHAEACIELIESTGNYRIIGLVGKRSDLKNQVLGYEVKFAEEDLDDLSNKNIAICIGIGQIESPEPRKTLFYRLKEKNFSIPTIISPAAYVSRHSEIGEGNQIFPHAMINVSSRIGANCIINTKALVEHDSSIGSHCHISTGAILNGSVHVGDETFIGSNATVRNDISIGKQVFIGMATSVLGDVPDMTKIVRSTF
jgi:sugar O-acyltransferase (sialic acid O-acetyltransferase NeuD family)